MIGALFLFTSSEFIYNFRNYGTSRYILIGANKSREVAAKAWQYAKEEIEFPSFHHLSDK